MRFQKLSTRFKKPHFHLATQQDFHHPNGRMLEFCKSLIFEFVYRLPLAKHSLDINSQTHNPFAHHRPCQLSVILFNVISNLSVLSVYFFNASGAKDASAPKVQRQTVNY
jgi:hypothetical protein